MDLAESIKADVQVALKHLRSAAHQALDLLADLIDAFVGDQVAGDVPLDDFDPLDTSFKPYRTSPEEQAEPDHMNAQAAERKSRAIVCAKCKDRSYEEILCGPWGTGQLAAEGWVHRTEHAGMRLRCAEHADNEDAKI
jgi:hypothetical protein